MQQQDQEIEDAGNPSEALNLPAMPVDHVEEAIAASNSNMSFNFSSKASATVANELKSRTMKEISGICVGAYASFKVNHGQYSERSPKRMFSVSVSGM